MDIDDDSNLTHCYVYIGVGPLHIAKIKLSSLQDHPHRVSVAKNQTGRLVESSFGFDVRVNNGLWRSFDKYSEHRQLHVCA